MLMSRARTRGSLDDLHALQQASPHEHRSVVLRTVFAERRPAGTASATSTPDRQRAVAALGVRERSEVKDETPPRRCPPISVGAVSPVRLVEGVSSHGCNIDTVAVKVGDVIDAMRSIQTEGERWHLAEELATVIPKGDGEGTVTFATIIDQATSEGVAGKLSVTTLRLYRDTAKRWPKSKRVPNVSFSAHRTAMTLPIDGAAKSFRTTWRRTRCRQSHRCGGS
jgi:hypothetical protein